MGSSKFQLVSLPQVFKYATSSTGFLSATPHLPNGYPAVTTASIFHPLSFGIFRILKALGTLRTFGTLGMVETLGTLRTLRTLGTLGTWKLYELWEI